MGKGGLARQWTAGGSECLKDEEERLTLSSRPTRETTDS